MANDVYCAFTGAIPDEADLPGDHPLEDEDLTDLPVGWTRITVQTREANPEWETILAVEQGMVKQIMDSIPKAQRKEATPGVRVQVAAQLAALKAATPPYNIVTEIFHVAAGDDESEAAKGLTRLRELLGGDVGDEGDEGDEEAEAESAEPAEESAGA
jgi:hypothetical protein